MLCLLLLFEPPAAPPPVPRHVRIASLAAAQAVEARRRQRLGAEIAAVG